MRVLLRHFSSDIKESRGSQRESGLAEFGEIFQKFGWIWWDWPCPKSQKNRETEKKRRQKPFIRSPTRNRRYEPRERAIQMQTSQMLSKLPAGENSATP